jgi:hypothetical protein
MMMVLLRKKTEPEAIGDYRPISLMHSFGKLITKCLASRLSTFLDVLIKKNQTPFIRGRTVQAFKTILETFSCHASY